MQAVDTLDQQARARAKAYMGATAWPTVLLGVAVTASYAATLLLTLIQIIPILLALPLLTVLTYLAYTVMHDAVHGSINGSNASLRWLNETMGYLAGQILMIPLTAHRHEHLAHHRNTNDIDADPDHHISDITRSPLAAMRAAGRSVVNQYTYYLKHRWPVAAKSQNLYFTLETVVALAWRLAFMAQGFWLEGALLFLVSGLGGVMILMYLFAYIVHRPHQNQGRYLDTSTIVLPGLTGRIMTALWCYQNYHSIHHLFPRIPFYKYRALFEEIEDIMVTKEAPVYRMGLRGLQPQTSFLT